MITIGDAILWLKSNSEGLDKGLEDADKKAQSWAAGLGKKTAKLIGGAVVLGVGAATAAVVGIGKAAFDAGMEFDDAFDTISVATGATGDELEQLQGDFKAVFTSIPTEAAPAADVIAALNQRLGLTGEELQGLSKPLLEVTRLLGGDAKTNAELFTRVMGDWGVPAEEGVATLDKLFVAAQESGIGIDQLMTSVVQFGSPLRLMGFSLEESAALFAKWEKEGVNAELVMGSLRIAAGNFADAGKPLRESLLATFEAIQQNENATDALALGMEVFGARAGPDMVAAIREGRFSVDDLVAAMGDAEGAVMDAAAETADFGEKFKVLKNKVTTALAPVGGKIIDVANKLADKLAPGIDKVVGLVDRYLVPGVELLGNALGKLIEGDVEGFFRTLIPGEVVDRLLALKDTFDQVVQFVEANAKPILAALAAMLLVVVVPAFVTWAGAAGAAAVATIAALAPVLIPIAAIGAAVGLLVAAWENDWLGIRTTLTEVWDSKLKPIFDQLVAWLKVAIPAAIETLKQFWDEKLLPAIKAVWSFIQTYLVPLFEALANVVIAIVKKEVEALSALWTNVLKPAIETVWQFIQEKVIPVLQAVAAVVAETLGPKLQWLKEKILDPVTGAFKGIGDAIQKVIDWLTKLADGIGNLKLPDWLTPGSPTPWENGLRGISKAMRELAQARLPELRMGLQMMMGGQPVGLAPAAGMAGRGGDVIVHFHVDRMDVSTPRAAEREARNAGHLIGVELRRRGLLDRSL